MNKVIICGRLTRDPDVRWTQGMDQTCVARYTVAVDRPGKKEDGTRQADFISCVAFRRAGEFAEKYLRQGMKILVTGRIQTGSYTNREGQKVYTTDVVVEEQEFVESRKNTEQNSQAAPQQQDADGFMTIPDDVEDTGLPFN